MTIHLLSRRLWTPVKTPGGPNERRHLAKFKGAKLGAIPGGSVRTAVDLGGLEKPIARGCIDSSGRPWTRLGDLRIRRLRVRVLPSALRKTALRKTLWVWASTEAAPRTADV